ncbi:hypothetical protein M3Y99_00939100 [Aphelenchoides fujianensis]|nr:hypothetical protein M3Y99_00939100 [Aphelenchoides fujianensis]
MNPSAVFFSFLVACLLCVQLATARSFDPSVECADQGSNCPLWAKEGHCDTVNGWAGPTKYICPLSCGLCAEEEAEETADDDADE